MKTAHILGIFILGSLIAVTSRAETIAQRLGYGPNDKVLLLHADDMGMHDLTNKACREVIDYGMVKSASIMMPAPAARAAIQENPDLDLGVHVTLTSEWDGYRWRPVAGPEAVPSLISWFSDGFMVQRRESLLFWTRSRDVEKEIRAQVQRALEWGLKPTHMDSHMAGVFIRKSFGESYLKVAKEFQIPPMIVRWSDDLKAQLPPFIMNHLKKSSKKAEKRGFLPFDHIVLGVEGTTYAEKKQGFIEQFKKLKPGATMIFMHPSYFEDNHPFPEDVFVERQADIALMQDPELRQMLDDMGVKLIGWREIQEAYRWDEVN